MLDNNTIAKYAKNMNGEKLKQPTDPLQQRYDALIYAKLKLQSVTIDLGLPPKAIVDKFNEEHHGIYLRRTSQFLSQIETAQKFLREIKAVGLTPETPLEEIRKTDERFRTDAIKLGMARVDKSSLVQISDYIRQFRESAESIGIHNAIELPVTDLENAIRQAGSLIEIGDVQKTPIRLITKRIRSIIDDAKSIGVPTEDLKTAYEVCKDFRKKLDQAKISGLSDQPLSLLTKRVSSEAELIGIPASKSNQEKIASLINFRNKADEAMIIRAGSDPITNIIENAKKQATAANIPGADTAEPVKLLNTIANLRNLAGQASIIGAKTAQLADLANNIRRDARTNGLEKSDTELLLKLAGKLLQIRELAVRANIDGARLKDFESLAIAIRKEGLLLGFDDPINAATDLILKTSLRVRTDAAISGYEGPETANLVSVVVWNTDIRAKTGTLNIVNADNIPMKDLANRVKTEAAIAGIGDLEVKNLPEIVDELVQLKTNAINAHIFNSQRMTVTDLVRCIRQEAADLEISKNPGDPLNHLIDEIDFLRTTADKAFIAGAYSETAINLKNNIRNEGMGLGLNVENLGLLTTSSTIYFLRTDALSAGIIKMPDIPASELATQIRNKSEEIGIADPNIPLEEIVNKISSVQNDSLIIGIPVNESLTQKNNRLQSYLQKASEIGVADTGQPFFQRVNQIIFEGHKIGLSPDITSEEIVNEIWKWIKDAQTSKISSKNTIDEIIADIKSAALQINIVDPDAETPIILLNKEKQVSDEAAIIDIPEATALDQKYSLVNDFKNRSQTAGISSAVNKSVDEINQELINLGSQIGIENPEKEPPANILARAEQIISDAADLGIPSGTTLDQKYRQVINIRNGAQQLELPDSHKAPISDVIDKLKDLARNQGVLNADSLPAEELLLSIGSRTDKGEFTARLVTELGPGSVLVSAEKINNWDNVQPISMEHNLILIIGGELDYTLGERIQIDGLLSDESASIVEANRIINQIKNINEEINKSEVKRNNLFRDKQITRDQIRQFEILINIRNFIQSGRSDIEVLNRDLTSLGWKIRSTDELGQKYNQTTNSTPNFGSYYRIMVSQDDATGHHPGLIELNQEKLKLQENYQILREKQPEDNDTISLKQQLISINQIDDLLQHLNNPDGIKQLIELIKSKKIITDKTTPVPETLRRGFESIVYEIERGGRELLPLDRINANERYLIRIARILAGISGSIKGKIILP